jgi:hypothetical protein
MGFGLLGVVGPPPWPPPRGGPATPKSPPPPPPKKKKTKNGFWPFGGGRTTPKGLGVDSATPYRPFGVAESTPRPLGVVRPPPKGQNPFLVFFFFLGFWGWPDHPLGHGGGSTTPRPAVGVAPATPDFFPPPPPLFNIFLFLFSFLFFFKKN